ncbi:hypothetical protein C3V44_03590 [Capnocytophaga sp. oral taxon 864]|nr:hypothetical protein C3V44_03590 [Capnocytophaga sp. oral taxon 864]
MLFFIFKKLLTLSYLPLLFSISSFIVRLLFVHRSSFVHLSVRLAPSFAYLLVRLAPFIVRSSYKIRIS